MRLNVIRTIESVLFIGLLMPAGMLFGIQTNQPPAVTSNSANWEYSQVASNLLNEMQTIAIKARNDVGPLQVQETQLNWLSQSDRLARAKDNVNKLADDLAQLDQMKGKLEPWEQSLVNKVTPHIHELVYQMNAAIKELDARKSSTTLAMTQYPQNINMIYKNANQTAGTIGTVTQYARAEQKMAALDHKTGKVGS